MFLLAVQFVLQFGSVWRYFWGSFLTSKVSMSLRTSFKKTAKPTCLKKQLLSFVLGTHFGVFLCLVGLLCSFLEADLYFLL